MDVPENNTSSHREQCAVSLNYSQCELWAYLKRPVLHLPRMAPFVDGVSTCRLVFNSPTQACCTFVDEFLDGCRIVSCLQYSMSSAKTKKKRFVLEAGINFFAKARAKQVEVDELAEDSVIIAVVGPTGSGKSAFINTATGYPKGVGHGLEPCTSDITIVKLSFPELVSTDVFFVDTPGFDGTEKTDTEIFDMIKKWLNARSKRNIKLSGLLHFHRISDNRMGSTPLKNLRMFEKLVGKDFHNIILTTTMWDEVDIEAGEAREEELQTHYWKFMIERGSKTQRFNQTAESAFQILAPLLDEANKRETLLLQKEVTDLGLQLRGTSAGRKLFSELVDLVKRQQEMLERIRDEMKKTNSDQDELQALMEEYQKITTKLASVSDQMKGLKIPIGARLSWATKMVFGWAFFKGLFKSSPMNSSVDFIQVDGAEDNQSFITASNSPHDNDDEPPPSKAAAERKPLHGSELKVPIHSVAHISHSAAGAGSQGPSDKAQEMLVYNPEPKVGYRSADSTFQPPASVGGKADAPVALQKPVGQPQTASAVRNPRGSSHPTALVTQSRQNGVQQMPANKPEAHLATRPNTASGRPEGTVTRERSNESMHTLVIESDLWLSRNPGADGTRHPPPASIPQGRGDGRPLPVPEKPTSSPRCDEKRSQGKVEKPQPLDMDPNVRQVAPQPSLQHVSARASRLEVKVDCHSDDSACQPPASVGAKAEARIALQKPVDQLETASAVRNLGGPSHPTVLVTQSHQNGVQQMPANRPEAHLATRPNTASGRPESTVTRERSNEVMQTRVIEPDLCPRAAGTRRPPLASIPQAPGDGPPLPVPEKPTSSPRRDEKRSQGKGEKPQPSNMDPNTRQVASQPLQHVSARTWPYGANCDADDPQGFPEKPIHQAQVRPNDASPDFPNPKSSASLAPTSNARPSPARLCKDEDAASAHAMLAELRNQLTGMVSGSNHLGGGLVGERQKDDLDSDLDYMKYRVNRVRQDLDRNSMGPRTASKEGERRWIEREVLSLLRECIPEAERKVKVCEGEGDTT